MSEPAKQRHPIPVPFISACLIVKDSRKTIERALESIRPFVDEVCIYDTGSTDGTVKLLEKLNGLRSVRFDKDGKPVPMSEPAAEGSVPLAPIIVKRAGDELSPYLDPETGMLTDFSFARQQSFEMVSDECSWYLWLDDDDELRGTHQLRQLAYSAAPEIDGFIFKYDYAQDERGQSVCELWRERLIRRSAGLRWTGAVHEVLIPPEGHAPNFVMVDPEQVLYVHHRPPDRYDPSRNLRILQAEERRCLANGEEVPPRSLAYLGTEHMAKGDLAEAAPYLERYLAHPESGWSDERMQVQHKLSICLRLLGNPQAAIAGEMNALMERDDWAETYVGLAESFAALGSWERVERWAKRALELGQPRSMLILNPLEFSFLPLIRLGEAASMLGHYDEAERHFQQAIQVAPGHPAALEKLVLLAEMRKEGETVNALLALREQLVRHDENLKALQIMESAPYYVSEHPAVVRARAEQREMVKHYLKPEEYQRWYAEEPKESTYPWSEIDKIPELFPRVAYLLEGLVEQEAELGRKPRVLDLGCNDWALVGATLWRKGYACDGVELNKGSYERALELVEAEGASGEVTIVQGDLHDADELLGHVSVWPDEAPYDAVSIFEVLEHVPDVERALAVAESLLRPGGRVYLTTPNGAFERGNLPAWSRVERKGHLRALPVYEIAETVMRRGAIEDCRLHAGPTNDHLTFLAYTPCVLKGKVVFYAGAGWEPWSPASIQQGGLGGSETALVQVACRFAMAGYEVKVYAGAEPGIYAGALWRPHTAWDPTEECDLLVVSRMPHVFDNPLGAKQTALWCHDHSYPGLLTEQRADKIDHIVVLSDWQRERFARLYPFAINKLQVIRNGIGLSDPVSGADRFAKLRRKGFAKRKPRVVYSSSADRGLDVLLKLWPKIRERAPEAELHIFYGWDVFDRVAQAQPALLEYKRHVHDLYEQAGGEQGGIFFRGRIGQSELAVEMGKARVLAYPTAFLETSCITAMEARAAGLPIVTSALAALNETVGKHGCLIAWGKDEDLPRNTSEAYGDEFVSAVLTLLTDREAWKKARDAAIEGVASFDWSERLADWEALLEPVRERELALVA